MKFVDQSIELALHILDKDWRGEPINSSQQKNLDLLMDRLVLITQHIRDDDPEEVQLENHLREEIEKVRQRAENDEYDETDKRFLALYDERLSSGSTCQ